MARAGSQSDFASAAEDLRCYAGLPLVAREIQRVAEEVGRQVEGWLATQQAEVLHAAKVPRPLPSPLPKLYASFDGTGVPMCAAELVGRRGKQADGSARTREAKLWPALHVPSGEPRNSFRRAHRRNQGCRWRVLAAGGHQQAWMSGAGREAAKVTLAAEIAHIILIMSSQNIVGRNPKARGRVAAQRLSPTGLSPQAGEGEPKSPLPTAREAYTHHPPSPHSHPGREGAGCAGEGGLL
jgi:hypothetical protein